MSVPDWPTSYGYNMFALPISMWLTGGVFHEHTHRLWASLVGVMVVALTRWAGGRPARLPLAIVGGVEVLSGQVQGPDLALGLTVQAGWLVVAAALFVILWRKGVKRYSAVGG